MSIRDAEFSDNDTPKCNIILTDAHTTTASGYLVYRYISQIFRRYIYGQPIEVFDISQLTQYSNFDRQDDDGMGWVIGFDI